VNLRASEAGQFNAASDDTARHDGYYLKSFSGDGQIALRQVRSHVHFADWSVARAQAEAVLSLHTVHLVTITVTESGY
jgi:D-arabinitol 4-dehydrogenase